MISTVVSEGIARALSLPTELRHDRHLRRSLRGRGTRPSHHRHGFSRRLDELYKAYDAFARSGTWVIAIDDTVEPKYADSLKLDERGQPTHVRGWEMPELINGVYQHAVLRPSSEGEGTLHILASYGISSGNGHILAALRVRDHAITSPANSSLNDGSRYGKPPVLAEHVPRTGVEPPKLISGSAYTPWTGLALHGETLLISARGRGLLVLWSTFGRNTRPEAVDVGGECLDVLVDDDRIWVLVGGSTTSLAEYTWEGDTLRELARTVLPSEYDEIVD